MVTLNDYLYSGSTILSILKNYEKDLRKDAIQNKNQIDLVHCNFLLQYTELLEHNDFITSQSQLMREFYMYLAGKYPYLAFTFKGRIKSLLRAESKFNGYIIEFIYEYYEKNGKFPSVPEIREKASCFRDLIAYRIVISLPKCNLPQGASKEKEELIILYEIANALPEFLEERGFTAELSGLNGKVSPLLDPAVAPYYRDYIAMDGSTGYKSLHISFYDNAARSYIEVQLRTKDMDDFAEIGPANHLIYENQQMAGRSRHDLIRSGENLYFDEAYERFKKLQSILLKDLDVNMFSAISDTIFNDSCGLYRGRQILPYEHLSKFQSGNI